MEEKPTNSKTAPAGGRLATRDHTPRRLTSAEILNDRCEVIIEHAGRDYRLRLTKNGKLILTA